MVGETLEGKSDGNNYIVYRGDKTRDFDLKLQMKIEKGGGGGIQYRSVTGVPWTRPQPAGQPPYDLKFMMTGPQADFWFPVSAETAAYTGQWYSENTMQGILAYRGQVTQALPGQTNIEVRAEVFNLFNRDNFANPVGTLPNALGTAANQVQPEQPYTAAAAGTFGKITSTVGRTVGLGTNRQAQFAVRFNW